MTKMMINEALSQALHEEMARDEHVFVMGEDCRISMMGRTTGLLEAFGPARVRNTPISEAGVVGAAIGAAASGMVPVVDLMMINFAYVCMDQILNNAGKLRYMMGGSSRFPLTLVASTGAAGGLAAQHSDSSYAQIVNGGGIKVVLPTTAADAKGLFKAAIRDPNPVLFLVPMTMGAVSGEVPEGEHLTPFGVGRVAREGEDVTIVAIGAMVPRAEKAARELAKAGVSAEVIDPRSLHPFDHVLVAESVRKTGHLVVVDEARRSCSLASEVVARVATDAYGALRAAPRILANPDVHVPYAPALEAEVIPRVDQIVEAASAVRGAAVAG
jgi:acetoin:2,6-dichlorophenolindophenol oxidoreductase subunit beta